MLHWSPCRSVPLLFLQVRIVLMEGGRWTSVSAGEGCGMRGGGELSRKVDR